MAQPPADSLDWAAEEEEPSDRLDWMADDLQGHERTLQWYLDRAKNGDQRAARRALELIVQALSPEAMQVSGWTIHAGLAEALRLLLEPVAAGQESPVLKFAVERPRHRPKDHSREERLWWSCLEMRLRPESEKPLGLAAAARAVLEAEGNAWRTAPGDLVKEYQQRLPALNEYVISLRDHPRFAALAARLEAERLALRKEARTLRKKDPGTSDPLK